MLLQIGFVAPMAEQVWLHVIRFTMCKPRKTVINTPVGVSTRRLAANTVVARECAWPAFLPAAAEQTQHVTTTVLVACNASERGDLILSKGEYTDGIRDYNGGTHTRVSDCSISCQSSVQLN